MMNVTRLEGEMLATRIVFQVLAVQLAQNSADPSAAINSLKEMCLAALGSWNIDGPAEVVDNARAGANDYIRSIFDGISFNS